MIPTYSLKKYKPVDCQDLVRIGAKFDGGYILSKRQVTLSKFLLGLGLSDNWTFEKQFKTESPSIKIIAVDYSISRWDFFKIVLVRLFETARIACKLNYSLFRKSVSQVIKFIRPIIHFRWIETQTTFIRKKVDKTSNSKSINAETLFKLLGQIPDLSVFIKMDIESSEYDVLLDFIPYFSKINGLVIEFHELETRWPEFESLLTEFEKKFSIIHIHGNNFSKMITNSNIPNSLEVSFIHKELITPNETKESSKVYPIVNLDSPNCREKPDIDLNFY